MLEEHDTTRQCFDQLTKELTTASGSPISEEDRHDYVNTIMDAFEIHLDRERIRHALWKDYSAADQVRPIRLKADRITRSLEHDHVPTQEHIDNAVEELLDIINYANFAIRKLRGQA